MITWFGFVGHWLIYCISILISASALLQRYQFAGHTLPHNDNNTMGPPMSLGDNAMVGLPMQHGTHCRQASFLLPRVAQPIVACHWPYNTAYIGAWAWHTAQ